MLDPVYKVSKEVLLSIGYAYGVIGGFFGSPGTGYSLFLTFLSGS